MKSDLPKVLHPIHGRPMIAILLDTLVKMSFDRIVVVVGHKGEMVQEALSSYHVSFVWQREQLGTGHAVKMAKDQLADFKGTTLVLAGDVPLLSEESIGQLFHKHESTHSAATCLSAIFEDPTGYGRIVRDGQSDRLKQIVEHKDATPELRLIREVNTGTFCFDNQLLFQSLDQIRADNTQGEYYLTDAIKVMYDKGLPVSVVVARDSEEVKGVNSVDQLEHLERVFADRGR
ncbi:UDP-N-acetylglucosamine pyrophosphorylase [candidate division GN15 bacterium]|uniref:UDP-N-acetylglucosamine pyrophosphorylase n=1 Tax=candidate division GN15 bacterium TaxID=2072418 RepID=A0A855X625_9BACT|nr:MAG: UDP-N-acetylglucosamine pyrophosphorylase [candidate division GN15 bacterium]